MATGSGAVTAEELCELPRGRWRYELVRGELRQMAPSGHVHGKIAAALLIDLGAFVRAHKLGATYAAETGFLLRRSPDTVRAPDIAFVSARRLASAELSPEGYFPGAPDLAVEVLSPSDRDSDVAGKVADWLNAGCGTVVVIDPRQRIGTVHHPGAEPRVLTDRLTLPELMPGWSSSLDDLFR